jgi:adenosylcobinamide amidohydrolase
MSRTLHYRVEDGSRLPMLLWTWDEARTVASTASVGGGLGRRSWSLNAQVATDYSRRDQDRHGAELAASLGVPGLGVVMFTAADVELCRHAEDSGVAVDATVGLTHPTWAAAADEAEPVTTPGTINILVDVPVRLADAALLNAMVTVTEAKTQALLDAGIPGTGTASDAVTVVCRATGHPEPFAGPRSVWGARLARAVHAAVLAGATGR